MKRKPTPTPAPDCPCGSTLPLAQCCQPILSGQQTAPTAEALMRSRYTAYVLKDVHWLLASWHSRTRPAELDLATDDSRWLGLTVHEHQQQDADHATVRFTARYKVGGRAWRLHERSRFEREAGLWVYVDGEQDPAA
ncbi:YchJ family protein [Leeia sp.]|uniref:YchJ family protein n=1 Tax=Leeia sp. TaxID=2884678 RepID=UPI0035B2E1A7